MYEVNGSFEFSCSKRLTKGHKEGGTFFNPFSTRIFYDFVRK